MRGMVVIAYCGRLPGHWQQRVRFLPTVLTAFRLRLIRHTCDALHCHIPSPYQQDVLPTLRAPRADATYNTFTHTDTLLGFAGTLYI